MKKIMVVMASWHGGGAEFVARTWVSWLSKRGFQVTVVLTGEVFSQNVDLSEDFEILDLASKQRILGKIISMRQILLERKPDVVLSLQSHPNLILILASRLIGRRIRPKIAISERNIVSIGLRDCGLGHRLKIRLARHTYKWADLVVAISHPVAAELVSWFGVDDSRCIVVPNPATEKVEQWERPNPVNKETRSLRLVLPSRIVSQKRPTMLVEVAAELSSRGYLVSAVIFGSGPLRQDVESLARRLGVDLLFAGWVENWFEHCQSGDVVLLPSAKEGFGNVLLEAAAVGVPAVAASRALGVADAIIPGVTGELALIDDARGFADAVERARNLQVVGAENWLRRFSTESSGSLLVEALQSVTGMER